VAAAATSAAALAAGCSFGARGLSGRAASPELVEVTGARRADWEPGTPAAQGFDAAALDAALQAGTDLSPLRSLLVVRRGLLVAERYYAGASAAELQPVNSIAKSVSSMLVGQALQRGTLPGLSAPLRQLLPESISQVPASAAAEVTLEQVLTGRTGLVYDWVTGDPALRNAPDPVRFALSLPMATASPKAWNYNDAAVGLIGPVLARAEGLDLAALASRDLFAPLGIERFSWRRDRQDHPTAYGGLALRARDLMKLAWTMLDGGRWQGLQVLPVAWATDSIRSRGAASWRFANISNVGYGCLWFTGVLHGKAVAWGLGYGGQVLMLVPELRLAVGVTAASPRIDALASQTTAVFDLLARVLRSAID